MGADGAATMGTMFGQPTILQSGVRKLQKISDKLMLGVSGPVGVGQRISGIVGGLWDGNKLSGQASFKAMQIIREALAPMLMLEIRYATEAAKVIGQQAATSAALTTSILALPIDKQLRLYSFGCTGEPEEATEALPFVAIGSGQNLADPFLAFIRSIFWKERTPNLADGVFATFWALQHAIRRNTGGVTDPKQIMKLYRDDRGNPAVKELERGELEETEQAVNAAEEHLSQFDFGKTKAEPPPTPPATQN
jgi:20S proteasome alpha/beta subunit